ncbi:MAG: hypothetical protein D6722_07505 [Bacteroidetes bacterium]|nr:MAG: hypothetical protein D6722_07505 [Bacteroidota bacterium]
MPAAPIRIFQLSKERQQATFVELLPSDAHYRAVFQLKFSQKPLLFLPQPGGFGFRTQSGGDRKGGIGVEVGHV